MRGWAWESKALTRTKMETWQSVTRARANSVSLVVNLKVESTGIAGHKPYKTSATENRQYMLTTFRRKYSNKEEHD